MKKMKRKNKFKIKKSLNKFNWIVENSNKKLKDTQTKALEWKKEKKKIKKKKLKKKRKGKKKEKKIQIQTIFFKKSSKSWKTIQRRNKK